MPKTRPDHACTGIRIESHYSAVPRLYSYILRIGQNSARWSPRMGSRPIAYRVERCDRNENASRSNGRGDPAQRPLCRRPRRGKGHAADGGERSITRRAGEGAVANWMPAPCSRHQSYQYLMRDGTSTCTVLVLGQCPPRNSRPR